MEAAKKLHSGDESMGLGMDSVLKKKKKLKKDFFLISPMASDGPPTAEAGLVLSSHQGLNKLMGVK